MELKAFEKFVEQSLKAIPQDFRNMMKNITIEVEPDKIVIYQRAFDNYSPERFPSLIANVLQHEIGHYFGMDENQLEKYKRA